MMTNSKLLRSTLLVFLGTFLYALTIKLFLEPSGLVTGGTTGICLALQRTLGISLSVSVLVMDSLLLAWAYFDLGKSFVVQTIFSTLAYPFCLELCDILLQGRILTQDRSWHRCFLRYCYSFRRIYWWYRYSTFVITKALWY